MFQSEPGIIKVLRPKYAVAGINLRKRRTWFEGDPAPDPAPNPATPPANGNTGDDKGKTFTQDDLNRIVGERAARAKEAAIADLLKELGIDSADTLKAKVKAQADAEAASQTELEKAQQRASDLEAKLKAAQEQAALTAKQALEKERNTAILMALQTAQAEKPQSVLNLLLVEHAADVSAVMTEDGSIDAKKIGALADKAKAEYAGMFKSGSPGSPGMGGGKTPKPDSNSILDKLPKVRL